MYMHPKSIALLLLATAPWLARRFLRLPLAIESVSTHIAFPKTRKLAGLRDRLDAEIARYRSSPDYGRLVRKYRPAAEQRVRLARTER